MPKYTLTLHRLPPLGPWKDLVNDIPTSAMGISKSFRG